LHLAIYFCRYGKLDLCPTSRRVCWQRSARGCALRKHRCITLEQLADNTTISSAPGRDWNPGGAAPRPEAGLSMTDAQAHITAFWSTVAHDYEAHSGNVAAYGTTAYQRWEGALAAALPPPPAEILDVATGTGYLALAAAALGHRVTAIDLSPRMLEELTARAADRGLFVDARTGDAVAPAFPPTSFDVVTSRHFLWTLREPARAMASWQNLLRPGGRLVAVDGFWFTGPDESNVPPLFAQHYTAATMAELPLMHVGSPDPILKMLGAAGFVEATAEPRPELALEGGVPYIFTASRP
jgi:ubiquinone/menaquinone biosynthesis C-methylase UbiE